jgi:hypothetical protein
MPHEVGREWGELVRGAAPQPARWPRISVWHGNADRVVTPSNAQEILKQWTDVHSLSTTPSQQSIVDGYPRQVWLNDHREDVIESYSITQMGHGAPLATGDNDDECGAAGPFPLDVAISSSYHIAKFFGLPPNDRDPTFTERADSAQPRHLLFIQPPADSSTLWGEGSPGPKHGAGLDTGAVIARALKAAGLLKEG